MSVPSAVSSISYDGNNSTVTAYSVPFKFFAASHLTVVVTDEDGLETELALTTGFTATGAGVDAGGALLTVAAVPVTSTISIKRNTPMTNPYDWSDLAAWTAATLENNFDWLTMAAMDANRRATEAEARALRVPSPETAAVLPDAGDRADKFLGFDEDGAPAVFTALEVAAQFGGEIEGVVTAAQAAQAAAEAARDDAETAEEAAEAFIPQLSAPGLYRGNMLRLHKQIIDLETASNPDGYWVTGAGCGDSIAEAGTGPLGPFFDELEKRFGIGALVSTPFGDGIGDIQHLVASAFGGGAAAVSGTYTYLPNGRYQNIPAAGSVTDTVFLADRFTGFKKIVCVYGRRAGGGTITATVTQNGAPLSGGAKVANTGTGTAGSIGFLTFEAADGLEENGLPSIAITNATAASHYLGTIIYLKSGFVRIALSEGGSSLAQQNVYPTQNLIDLCEELDIGFIGHAFKEEDTDGSNLADHVDRMAANLPEISHLFINSSPEASDAVSVALNAVLLAKCQEHGLSYFDQRVPLRTYAELVANEMEDDGVHLSDSARNLSGQTIKFEFLRGLPAYAPRHQPITRLEMADDFVIRNTWRPACIFTFPQATGGTSVNWTEQQLAGWNGFYANSGTGPEINTYAGLRVLTRCRWRGNYDCRFRFGLDTNLPSGCHSGFAIGVTADAAATLAEQGIWVQVHGGAAPFVRILLHDGTNLYSDDFLLPLHSDTARGYVDQSGDDPWHNFGVHYISNGASTAKEVKVWVAPNRPDNAATARFRPILVAHWKQTVSAGSSFPASSDNRACFRVGAGATLGASSFPSSGFTVFEIDQSGDDLTSALPWNKR